MTEFIRPQGRRTIRRAAPFGPGNPLVPVDGRLNREIRMWSLGDGELGTTKEKLRRAYLDALEAVDKIGTRKADAMRSGKFTAAGAADEALQYALSELVPTFKRGRNTIDVAKAEAKSLRDTIKLKQPDKSDIVGAMHRREMREFLKAMPAKDRNRYVSQRRENMDPNLALAIVEMPAEFSGVLASDRNDLLDRALEAQHGNKMTQLRDLEHAIEVAASAVETGRDEVRAEAGLDERTFNERAAPAEAKARMHYLKKFIEDGHEVVRVFEWAPGGQTGSWRIPTPEQIATGHFYDSMDDYRRHNPADKTD
jgi:hypothetical protein